MKRLCDFCGEMLSWSVSTGLICKTHGTKFEGKK